jgi:tetratricopeptide (TPR) repeat protein
LRPTSSRFVLLADVQMQLRQSAKAEASLRQALRLEPNDDEALFNLAVLVRDRDPVEAIQLFLHAIEVDPRYAAAYRELAWTYLKQRLFDEAGKALENALRLDRKVFAAYLSHCKVIIS